MDKGTRVRLILEVRDRLDEHSWEDADLLLKEFGFSGMPGDNQFDTDTLTDVLRRGADDDLLALASHLSVETSLTSDLAIVPAPAEGPLLVFASHLAKHKAIVGEVETELAIWGVDLFVAHKSIHPDREWVDEIVKTLDRAHAGVAFLHDGFRGSDWCDQEVGWLLGRRVPVFSLKFDLAPYGPLGQRQAVDAKALSAEAMAKEVLDLAFGRTELHSHVASSLVEGLNRSRRFATTDAIWGRLRDLRTLDAAQCGRLLDALKGNGQVAGPTATAHPHSPWDSGEPYAIVIPRFIRQQPGAAAVEARLQEWERLIGVRA